MLRPIEFKNEIINSTHSLRPSRTLDRKSFFYLRLASNYVIIDQNDENMTVWNDPPFLGANLIHNLDKV